MNFTGKLMVRRKPFYAAATILKKRTKTSKNMLNINKIYV